MGQYLQIRVSAETFDPAAVEKAWPRLCALAGGENRVLSLAEVLFDKVRFGDVPAELKDRLSPGLEKAAALAERLEAALADRDPQTADALSYELEDRLAELEKLSD